MTKKEPKMINVSHRPIMIVGEKMGRQRTGQDRYALEGNRTGDFIHEAIEGMDNIILTNIVNLYYFGEFDHNKGVAEGLLDLIDLIEKYNPSAIICLGGISIQYITSISVTPVDCPVIHFPHPSWINRFKSSTRGNYIESLQSILKTLRHEAQERV